MQHNTFLLALSHQMAGLMDQCALEWPALVDLPEGTRHTLHRVSVPVGVYLLVPHAAGLRAAAERGGG